MCVTSSAARLSLAALLILILAVRFSPPLAAVDFIRGRCNNDASLDITDAVFLLGFLFLGEAEPLCLAACDANDDEDVDISDAVRILGFLFIGAAPPPPPFPDPGPDPTPGDLPCAGLELEPPAGLACGAAGPLVELTWTNGSAYDEVEVSRDGSVVARLAGDATSFADAPCRGGSVSYEVRGVQGGAPSDAATCTVNGVPENQPPAIEILDPVPGTVVPGAAVNVQVRVNDDSRVARVVIGGQEVTLPGQPQLPLTVQGSVDLSPGPNLIRVEAVDDFGRAAFAELALGGAQLLGNQEFTRGIAFDITGGPGYGEVEGLLQPFLDQLSQILTNALRGQRASQSFNVVFVTISVAATIDRVEATGPALDLVPLSGAVGFRGRVNEFKVVANGTSSIDNSFTVTVTASNVRANADVSFNPTADRRGVAVAVRNESVTIGAIDTSVSGFSLGPLRLDSVVNLFSGAFAGPVRSAVEDAVTDALRSEIPDALSQALASLLTPTASVGGLRLEARLSDILEASRGITVLLDTRWAPMATDPSYPPYPGSLAGNAPFPGTFLDTPDATLSFSLDTMNQALAGLAASGGLRGEFDLTGIDSPVPLTVDGLAAAIDPRLPCLPGVAGAALGLRVEARRPPTVILGEMGGGGAGELVAAGALWRHLGGTSEPDPDWMLPEYPDDHWPAGESGFGYSDDPTTLDDAIQTELPEMAAGAYSSLYLRGGFETADPEALTSPVLRVCHDGGFVAYLNGEEVARANIGGEPGVPPLHDALALADIDPNCVDVELPRHLLRRGTNVVAIQGHGSGGADFLLAPELFDVFPEAPLAGGGAGSISGQLALRDLEVAFVAGSVDLFAFRFGFNLAVTLELTPEGNLTLSFDPSDGPDLDPLPDAIVGGAGGIDIGVAFEAYDMADGELIQLAQLLLVVLGPRLGSLLEGIELPSIPLPELAFDVGGVRTVLGIGNNTFVAVDTNGGDPDWLSIQADLAR